jgi:uncharacterized ferritin-like protein (DUF455 family)
MSELFESAAALLRCPDPEAKAAGAVALLGQWRQGRLATEPTPPPQPIGSPGRPARPRLVAARDLPARGAGTVEGRAALVHAVAHIELNAIDLALDAVYRFRGLPAEYYGDWLAVAAEEALHFRLLRDHLQRLGFAYGDFDAHDGLWEMARRTAADPLLRMALVPRVLEARGLDVTPGMRERLARQGDAAAAAILDRILRDEVGHVGRGSYWFRHLCDQRGLSAGSTFLQLVGRHMPGRVRGPFNREARLRAGFDEAELRDLEALADG